MSGRIEKRSMVVANRSTSVALEDEFWRVLQRIASDRGTSLPRLISDVERMRAADQTLASALRVFAIS